MRYLLNFLAFTVYLSGAALLGFLISHYHVGAAGSLVALFGYFGLGSWSMHRFRAYLNSHTKEKTHV